MAEAIYTQTLTYTTPARVKVSVGDLVTSHRGQYVGIVTNIKRYGTTGRWQICYELLGDNATGYTRTTWAHTFAKFEHSLQHFKHEGA